MGKYTLVDKATGEEIEADADTVERVTGVEIGHIDWVLEQDWKFQNGDWGVRLVDKICIAASHCRYFHRFGLAVNPARHWRSSGDKLPDNCKRGVFR